MMDVFDFADVILEKICEEPEFIDKLEIDDDTFCSIRDFVDDYDLYPDYSELGLSAPTKDNQISYNHRMKGNDLFNARKYYSALCEYNKSLCFAEPGCEPAGLAYANRSAVYLKIAEFELCKENIKLAKENNYPKEKFQTLDKRERSCESFVKVEEDESSYLKLSYDPNPDLPFAVDCLELKSDKLYGRYITTSKRLNAGDIIAIEPPFCAMVLPDFSHNRCTSCLSQFNMNLLPCPGCTSAMFCSSSCRIEANKRFHKFECCLPSAGFAKFFSVAVKMALRTFFEGLNIFDGKVEKFKKHFYETVDRNTTMFDVKFDDSVNKKHLFDAINSLCTNVHERSKVELFKRAIVCAILWNFLCKYKCMESILLDNDENGIFLVNFMFRHTQIAESNYHELNALSPQKSHQENEQFGAASFPFCSMLSHSCSPNVYRLSFNGFNCIIVSRLIEQGEQILDNYGYHHALHPLKYRKKGLLEHYQFSCRCQACTKSFPLFEELPQCDQSFEDFIRSDTDILESFTIDEAKTAIVKYSTYIGNNCSNIPCYEISLVQECMLRCFRIFEKSQSRCIQKLSEW